MLNFNVELEVLITYIQLAMCIPICACESWNYMLFALTIICLKFCRCIEILKPRQWFAAISASDGCIVIVMESGLQIPLLHVKFTYT